ncbi:MAG: HEPN domain-containing protein [Melioribacteraceae bacterium]|nr:HEPN domain-containing protein [Melioribacteraceae bacterium]
MNKEELVKYWLEASEIDYKAMNNLFESKDYVWSLFIGHLVIEKLLKSLIVKNNQEVVPKIHNLNKLADATLLELDEDQKDLLDVITSFNIEARYPDYKNEFYKKCDYKFTSEHINQIKELRLWLLEQVKK